jgi:hypothetical protein
MLMAACGDGSDSGTSPVASPPVSFTLTITKDGGGTGTITSNPPGVICGTSCAITVGSGTVVTLIGEPNPNNTLSSWGGLCATASASCTVTVTSNQTVTTTFEVSSPSPSLAVSIGGNGNGTVTCNAALCASRYAWGTSILLSAVPQAGSAFAGWSGGNCAGSADCMVLLWDDTTVAAIFDRLPGSAMLSVTKNGTGTGTIFSDQSGINCGTSCIAIYSGGTVVNLTATASVGSAFAGWSGGGCSGTDTCNATLNVDRAVTATFNKVPPTVSFTVTSSGTGSGTVTCNGTACNPSYPAGSKLTIVARPATTSLFTGWGAACAFAGGSSSCELTINANTVVLATFDLPILAVVVAGTGTVTSSPSGINCGNACSASFNKGTSITLTASGTVFSGWTGGGCTGSGTCVVTLLQNTTVTATFTPPPPPNPIVAENQLLGTIDWKLTLPATNREIEGYASATSVNHGGPISFFVNTAAPTYTINVFRMGWYGGLGARRVFGPIQATGTRQTTPTPDPTTGLVDCAWTNPYILATDSSWVSGVYLAKLTESQNNRQSYIIFVVRNDEASSHFVLQLPFDTYQAYNFWGGKSLYDCCSGSQLPWGSSRGPEAVKVSFNRPYAASTNSAAAFGTGAGDFLANVHPVAQGFPISSAGWDYNLVRWLEKEGYDLSYITNIDLHTGSPALSRSRTFISSGHDEYWSWEMRDHLTTFRDAGGNLIFFGANPIYWQVRFESSQVTGKSNRVMVGWKWRFSEDPFYTDGIASNDQLVTTKWRDAPVSRPEDALVGVGYLTDPVSGDIVISKASHWVFQNTGLVNGSKLIGLLGFEVDGVLGHQPATTEILSASVATNLLNPSEIVTSNMAMYTWASGAQVFATGTMQWSWGLDDYNAPQLRPSRLNPAAIQITKNVLSRF